LRYDTRALFTDAASWSAYDASLTDGLATVAFQGAAHDGRYIYFVPNHDGTDYHGRVLRLDTQGDFKASSSWAGYDASNTGSLATKGYVGGFFDGRHVYFFPTKQHSFVLRYDSTSDFRSAASWERT
jgi:hypothetical protein